MADDNKLAALNAVLADARACAFYAQRIPQQPLVALAELASIPITTKDDLRRESPYGLLCVETHRLWQYHESYGTTGIPVSVWLTEEDLLHSAAAIANCGTGLRSDDIALIRYPYAISMIAHEFHAACHLRHTCVIPASSRSTVSPFSRVINLMRKLHVTILAALPLQALLLAETAELLGLHPATDFPALRAVYTAGELLTPHKRALLSGLWQVPVFDNYGSTELGPVGLDCRYGRLHPLQDQLVIELLHDDLATPVSPGETGHLVVTTLHRQATPMIRYLTGDLARLVPEPCLCGADCRLEVHGRSAEALRITGHNLTHWEIEAIVAELSQRTSLPPIRFWAAGPQNGGLHIVAEAPEPDGSLVTAACAALSDACGFPVSLEVLPAGSLYDRSSLLDVGTVGKPQYIFSEADMTTQAYLHAAKL